MPLIKIWKVLNKYMAYVYRNSGIRRNGHQEVFKSDVQGLHCYNYCCSYLWFKVLHKRCFTHGKLCECMLDFLTLPHEKILNSLIIDFIVYSNWLSTVIFYGHVFTLTLILIISCDFNINIVSLILICSLDKVFLTRSW